MTNSLRERARELKHWYTNQEDSIGEGPWDAEMHDMWHDMEHVCSCGEVFPDSPTWWAHHGKHQEELHTLFWSVFEECSVLVDQIIICCHGEWVCCWPPMNDDDGHGCERCEIGNHDRRGIAENKAYAKTEGVLSERR